MGRKKNRGKKESRYEIATFLIATLVHMLLLIIFIIFIFCKQKKGNLPDAVFYIAGGLLFLFISETILLIIFYCRQKNYNEKVKADCTRKMVNVLIKQFERGGWDDNLYIKTIQILNDNEMCK